MAVGELLISDVKMLTAVPHADLTEMVQYRENQCLAHVGNYATKCQEPGLENQAWKAAVLCCLGWNCREPASSNFARDFLSWQG